MWASYFPRYRFLTLEDQFRIVKHTFDPAAEKSTSATQALLPPASSGANVS